jgi:hypothetical protein
MERRDSAWLTRWIPCWFSGDHCAPYAQPLKRAFGAMVVTDCYGEFTSGLHPAEIKSSKINGLIILPNI